MSPSSRCDPVGKPAAGAAHQIFPSAIVARMHRRERRLPLRRSRQSPCLRAAPRTCGALLRSELAQKFERPPLMAASRTLTEATPSCDLPLDAETRPCGARSSLNSKRFQGPPSSGTAATRRRVYSCFGLPRTSFARPISTNCPFIITATRSAKARAIEMSWVIMR